MEATEERLVVYDVDVLDYQSILVSLKTSNAVFCLLDSPEGYDEKEVDLEVRGAINVKDVDEKCWSDQDFCRNKKLNGPITPIPEEQFRSKYELQGFLKPSLRRTTGKACSTKKLSFLNQFAEGMVEFIGLLEVAVKKDSLWILKAIVHKLQKTVVNCNLNPVWNQELMLSVPDSYGPVKLQVYDYDTFSAGDIMGEAQLDIQPLITSAMVFGDPEMFGDMQIGKWLNIINIVDGKVKQEVQIKLQNEESGELEL
ncbi:hypothetical protein Bca4012_072518 [Brassica carinata]